MSHAPQYASKTSYPVYFTSLKPCKAQVNQEDSLDKGIQLDHCHHIKEKTQVWYNCWYVNSRILTAFGPNDDPHVTSTDSMKF